MNKVYFGDNLEVMRELPSGSVALIYADPPFNTGKVQLRTSLRTVRSANGDRTGFGGRRYATERIASIGYRDLHDDYLGFL